MKFSSFILPKISGDRKEGEKMLQWGTFAWVLLFALLALVVNSLGILAIYKKREFAEKYDTYFMCFAAGILITAPLVLVFPQAVEKNSLSGFAALMGFLAMFFSNRIIQKRTKQKYLAFGITAVEGIALHSFVDGVIYSVTFNISILTGFLTGIGLVIHEFAEGVITFSVLVEAEISAKRAIWLAFLVSGLTTPLGALIAYPFISRVNSSVLGLLLGFVVGVLIYLSASHLLPEARGHERKHSPLAFIAGILLALFLVLTEII